MLWDKYIIVSTHQSPENMAPMRNPPSQLTIHGNSMMVKLSRFRKLSEASYTMHEWWIWLFWWPWVRLQVSKRKEPKTQWKRRTKSLIIWRCTLMQKFDLCVGHGPEYTFRCIVPHRAQWLQQSMRTFFHGILPWRRQTHQIKRSFPQIVCYILRFMVASAAEAELGALFLNMPREDDFYTYPWRPWPSANKNPHTLQQRNRHQNCKQHHKTATFEGHGNEIFMVWWQSVTRYLFLKMSPWAKNFCRLSEQASPWSTSHNSLVILPTQE